MYFGGGEDNLNIYFGGGTDNLNIYFRRGGRTTFVLTNPKSSVEVKGKS